MPDLNIILDDLYDSQISDAEARQIMHLALCNLRDAGDQFTLDDLALFLQTAAAGKLG